MLFTQIIKRQKSSFCILCTTIDSLAIHYHNYQVAGTELDLDQVIVSLIVDPLKQGLRLI